MESQLNSEPVKKNIKLDFKGSKYATGRRKKSIARVWLKKGSGNFVLINVNGGKRAEKIVKLLFREKVLIKGGFKEPCLENYIRVSVGSVKQMEVF